MLKEFLQNYEQKKAAKAWVNSALGQTLAIHSRKFFYEGILLSDFTEENKQKIIGDFYEKIFTLDRAQNPFLAMREAIAGYVCEYTRLQVLCLKETDLPSNAIYADCPYISGTLHRHIRALSQHNDELKQLVWTHDSISDGDLISYCNQRSALFLYFVNGMNLVRCHRGDLDKTKDWFLPFIKSLLIWDEDTCRSNIGLPSLLPNELDGLCHFTFLNMVTSGHANPYYAWEMAHKGDLT